MDRNDYKCTDKLYGDCECNITSAFTPTTCVNAPLTYVNWLSKVTDENELVRRLGKVAKVDYDNSEETPKIINYLIKHHDCVLIGSRQWGGWNTDSDWDMVITQKQYSTILQGIKCDMKDYRIYSHDLNYNGVNKLGSKSSCYFENKREGITINFIIYESTPDILDIWSDINETFKKVGKKVMFNKDKRILLAESLLEVYGVTKRPQYPDELYDDDDDEEMNMF